MPLAAVAITLTTGDAVVSWTTSIAPADAYRVYGITPSGTYVLLDEVSAGLGAEGGSTLVSADYATYAVSTIIDGNESSRQTALTLDGGSCIVIDPWDTPPAFGITCGPLNIRYLPP